MAESGNNTDESGGGWWGSLIAAAKEQSGKVYEMVSNDLTEFTNTMQTDTKQVVEKTKETLKTGPEGSENLNTTDRMKQSFHSLMSGITKVLTVEPEDTSPPKKTMSQPGTGIFDRAKARMRAIQVDTGTYLQEPSGPPEKYADWLKSFDLDANKGDISELLVTMVEVRSLYTSLVPSEVSHQDFWRRYFYKVHQLRMDEERKQALMKRAERVDVKEDIIDWDEEEEWSGDEDATPSKKSPVKKEEQESRLQPTVAEEVNATEKDKPSEVGQTKTDKSVNEQKLPDKTDESKSAEVRLKQEAEKEVDVNKGTSEMQEKENKATDDATQQEPTPILEQTEKVLIEGFKHLTETVKTFVSGDDKKDESDSCDTKDGTESEITKEESTPILEKTEKIVKEGFKHITETVKAAVSGGDTNTESEPCDKEIVVTEDSTKEKELKTKVKGDMVVVGDRVSPSSDSSGTKESSNEDWEQDFDVDVTPEDLAAASELAQKMNTTATDYNKITGGEDDDWENWD